MFFLTKGIVGKLVNKRHNWTLASSVNSNSLVMNHLAAIVKVGKITPLRLCETDEEVDPDSEFFFYGLDLFDGASSSGQMLLDRSLNDQVLVYQANPDLVLKEYGREKKDQYEDVVNDTDERHSEMLYAQQLKLQPGSIILITRLDMVRKKDLLINTCVKSNSDLRLDDNSNLLDDTIEYLPVIRSFINIGLDISDVFVRADKYKKEKIKDEEEEEGKSKHNKQEEEEEEEEEEIEKTQLLEGKCAQVRLDPNSTEGHSRLDSFSIIRGKLKRNAPVEQNSMLDIKITNNRRAIDQARDDEEEEEEEIEDGNRYKNIHKIDTNKNAIRKSHCRSNHQQEIPPAKKFKSSTTCKTTISAVLSKKLSSVSSSIQSNLACYSSSIRDKKESCFLDNVSHLDLLLLEKNGSLIDVVGIIESVDRKIALVNVKGKKLEVRRFRLTDMKNSSISVTLWGDQAIKFDMKEGTVLFLKQVKVTNYQGVSLSIMRVTSLVPLHEAYNIPLVAALRTHWAKRCNNNKNINYNNKNRYSTATVGSSSHQKKHKSNNYEQNDESDCSSNSSNGSNNYYNNKSSQSSKRGNQYQEPSSKKQKY